MKNGEYHWRRPEITTDPAQTLGELWLPKINHNKNVDTNKSRVVSRPVVIKKILVIPNTHLLVWNYWQTRLNIREDQLGGSWIVCWNLEAVDFRSCFTARQQDKTRGIRYHCVDLPPVASPIKPWSPLRSTPYKTRQMNQFDSDQKASKRDPKPAKLVMFRTKTDLWRLVCYFYPFLYNLNKKYYLGN